MTPLGKVIKTPAFNPSVFCEASEKGVQSDVFGCTVALSNSAAVAGFFKVVFAGVPDSNKRTTVEYV